MTGSTANGPKGKVKKSRPKSAPFTEVGNAEQFIATFGGGHRYCPQLKSWIIYDGRGRWRADTQGSVSVPMRGIMRDLLRRMANLDGDDLKNALRHWRNSETAKGIRGALEVAASELAIDVGQLDADPWLLGVKGGALDLRSGKQQPSRPEHFLTKSTHVLFNPDARSEELDAFLDHVTGGDLEYRQFLVRAFGYSLTGSTREDKLFLLLGPSRTGKSTLLLALGATLGDYACSIPFEALLLGRGRQSGPRPELARCVGSRLVTASEVPEGREFNAATIKSLTGGDRIVVHGKFQHPFETTPGFKLWLAANDAPRFVAHDEASRERLLVLPFLRQPEEIDQGLRDRLQKPAVRAALLALAVRGCIEWQQMGLGSCEAVDRATQRYWDGAEAVSRADSLFERFLRECVERDPDAKASSRAIYEALAGLAQRVESPCPSKKRLGTVLAAQGFQRADTAKERGWQGLRVRASVGSPAMTE